MDDADGSRYLRGATVVLDRQLLLCVLLACFGASRIAVAEATESIFGQNLSSR